MSKGNMLLGHARGKVGDLVFSRTNGQQVVRARAAVVKNPQTEAQMIQRIIMNSVSQAYSKMQPIVDHSFEGLQSGQKTMSEFIRRNLHLLRQKVSAAVADPTIGLGEVRAFTPIGNNGFAVNNFIVSTGSLPAVVPYLSTRQEGESFSEAYLSIGANTYEAVINKFGLKRGDQLTLCCICGLDALNARFTFSRIILDPTNPDGSAAPLSSALVVNNAVNLPSDRNTGVYAVLQVNETGVLAFNTEETRQNVQACFIIVSRKGTDGTWKRSNAAVVTSPDSEVLGYSMLECLMLFEEGGVGTLSDMYLNNAGTGTVANSSSTASSVVWPDGFGNDLVIVGVEHQKYFAEGVSPAEQRDYYMVVDAGGGRHPIRNDSNDSSPKYGFFQLFNEDMEWAGSLQKPDGFGANYVQLMSLDSPQAVFLYNHGLNREQLTLPME